MTMARKRHRIGRVLVALDASPSSLAAAHAAARLAALLDVELTGLFVEDLELVHLSHSPMAHQIDLLTAELDRFESQVVERQFRVQALRAREALARMAEEAGLEWSFKVARGTVSKEIQAAARDSDVVTLGRIGWSLRHRRELGSSARALLAEQRRCTLLIERQVEFRPPVVVLFDGSTPALDALDLGASLVDEGCEDLAVILMGRDPDRLREQLVERLGAEPPRTTTVEVGDKVAVRLGQLVRSIGAGLLILAVGEGAFGAQEVADLLAEVDCPVLVVS